MPHTDSVQNPFMLMLNPEVVLAAMERSERLSQLNRHFCRPLDKPAAPATKPAAEALDDTDGEADGQLDSAAAG